MLQGEQSRNRDLTDRHLLAWLGAGMRVSVAFEAYQVSLLRSILTATFLPSDSAYTISNGVPGGKSHRSVGRRYTLVPPPRMMWSPLPSTSLARIAPPARAGCCSHRLSSDAPASANAGLRWR